jgi:hypothetical protein
MKKINNSIMQNYTTERKTFTTNNETVYAQFKHNRNMDNDLYVVYSYGEHFPMYVFDTETVSWFGNEDKYSPTTSKHQTLARPDTDDMTMLPTDELRQMIELGGYAEYCAVRCGSMYYKHNH